MQAGSEEDEASLPVVGAWSWGAGTDGQLGTAIAQDYHLPQPLPHFPMVSHIACGGAHAIALTRDGKVLSWGRGSSGQLGHGEFENSCQPKPVKFFERLVVSCVSAGWNHSGFVTDTGCLFMCGDGSFGQLGKGDNISHAYPSEVPIFASQCVKEVACGMRHSLVLLAGSSEECVYGFGSGKRGQLGRYLSGAKRSTNLPDVVQGLNNSEIASIHANGDHSAALSADGLLYLWGRGFGGRSDNHIPQLVPSSMSISKVALGWNHALALADGELYMVGGYHHGLLSGPLTDPVNKSVVPLSSTMSSDEAFLMLEKVQTSSLDGQKVVSIAAGAEHSALVTEKGVVMTWGWGEHGQLGLGDTSDQTLPQVVPIDDDGSFYSSQLSVYCGSGFTIVTKLAH